MSQIFLTSSSSLLLSLLLLLLLLLHRNPAASAAQTEDFVFNGFKGANLTLDGIATITPAGLLMLTNASKWKIGHAFLPSPLHFRDLPDGTVFSFSTTFVFGIVAEDPALCGHGLTFVISSSKDFSTPLGGQYFGLFNISDDGNSTKHILAIELDTILSPEFQDINDNHVGIDINSLTSNISNFSGYYADDTGLFQNLSLISGKAMQVWVDYDAKEMKLNVTLAPVPMAKPRKPLLSTTIDLSGVFSVPKYIGFSAATGPFLSCHCVLGWSFMMNGVAQNINHSLLPSLPPRAKSKPSSKVSEVSMPIA